MFPSNSLFYMEARLRICFIILCQRGIYDWLEAVFRGFAFGLTATFLYELDKDDANPQTIQLYNAGLAGFDDNAPSYHLTLQGQPQMVPDQATCFFSSRKLCYRHKKHQLRNMVSIRVDDQLPLLVMLETKQFRCQGQPMIQAHSQGGFHAPTLVP